MSELSAIFVGAFLVNNIVLMRFLGLCPFFGVSTKFESALGMGMAVIFVMTMASWITWMLYNFLLFPAGLIFLRTAAFILVIASLVQLVEMFLKRSFPALYSALGIYLPLITTNCAILAVTFLNIDNTYNPLKTTIFAIGNGIGFTMVLLIFASIRERLALYPIPRFLRGHAIAFIAASLVSLAFLGFIGLFGIG